MVVALMANNGVQVEIFARETIKPSKPTPSNLKTFTFSCIDQFIPPIYFPLIFFYPYKDDPNGNNHLVVARERSLLLKASLSNVLTRYHPFAGRIKDHVSIECNDEGVLFVEARVNGVLFDVLQHPDVEQLNKFIPKEPRSKNVATGNLILVQVNFFQCGGMAIGLCFSHKLADATTISTFMKDWASTTLDCDTEVLVHPEFIAASLFPPVDQMFPTNNQAPRRNSVRRRFVFDESSVAAIQALASSANNQQPTRVEAVTALIWNCAMKTSRSILGPSRPSLCFHAVNLRKRFSPPLSEHTIGNLLGGIVAQIGETHEEMGLQNLVSQLRKEKQEFRVTGDIEKLFKVDVMARFVQKKDVDVFSFTSWCRMQLYEGDFGWGKPIWVAPIRKTDPHVVILMDTRDGEGIEAWVYLTQEEMTIFECDQELLSFASMNPSVLSEPI